MAAMTALTTLCPPPGPTSNIHWETVEANLGMPLPQDYKELADRYGPGVFNGFVHVYHPHGATEHADLTGPVPGRIRARLSRDREQGTHPVPYDPETLFACAVTDNGEYLFWITDPAGDPDRWRIAVNQARGPDWFTYDGTLTAFLTAVLGGRIEVPLFPVSSARPPPGSHPPAPFPGSPAPSPVTGPSTPGRSAPGHGPAVTTYRHGGGFRWRSGRRGSAGPRRADARTASAPWRAWTVACQAPVRDQSRSDSGRRARHTRRPPAVPYARSRAPVIASSRRSKDWTRRCCS